MNTNQKKKKIMDILLYLQEQGVMIDIDVQAGIGARIFLKDKNEKVQRDISDRLNIKDMYNFITGFKAGIEATIHSEGIYSFTKRNIQRR